MGIGGACSKIWRHLHTNLGSVMKVSAIETINLEEYPNVLWVHIHTDAGVVGLGETFYAVEPVIAHIHQTIAPYLLGQDPLRIDKHSRHMLYNYLGFKTVGA